MLNWSPTNSKSGTITPGANITHIAKRENVSTNRNCFNKSTQNDCKRYQQLGERDIEEEIGQKITVSQSEEADESGATGVVRRDEARAAEWRGGARRKHDSRVACDAAVRVGRLGCRQPGRAHTNANTRQTRARAFQNVLGSRDAAGKNGIELLCVCEHVFTDSVLYNRQKTCWSKMSICECKNNRCMRGWTIRNIFGNAGGKWTKVEYEIYDTGQLTEWI